MRRPVRSGGVAAAALALLLVTACERAATPCADRPALSLLAVGDTGRVNQPAMPLSDEWMVARSLAREDQRCPADALLLLGDNFYNSGLESREMVKRLRQNVVGPFCRFVATGGPRSREVDSACVLPARRRHVIPLYVVLGNHDYVAPESPGLERHAVPDFVPNWRAGKSVLDVVELPHGVSLLLYDPLADGIGAPDPQKLVAALRASRGPWRIIASHYPIARAEGDPAPDEDIVAEPMRRALREAGVRPQLALAGHEHALYAALLPDGGLQVVTGSGSQVFPAEMRFEGARLARADLGFARIDLERDASGERLRVSIYAVAWGDALLGRPAELAARYTIDPAGRVRDELAAPGQDAARFGTLRAPAPRGEVPESG